MIRPLLLSILVCLGVKAWCAEIKHIPAAKIGVKPSIDGVIGADEWAGAVHVTGFGDPITGKPAPDQTEVWIAYDTEAIYVAYLAHDPMPNGIVAREVTPGAQFDGEDTLTLNINPFGNRLWDGRSRFTLNALNTQSDDIAGGRAAKKEWRGEWQSATRRLPDGWSAEFCIPWRVLDYPPGGPLNMDLEFERYQARTKVFSRWACTGQQERPEESAIWSGVQPPKRSERRRVDYIGYIAPEYEDTNFRLRAGLDARAALTPTLTGLLSISPDFRNIESQVAGIDFTRTERYLDDSRPFFNEGGGFFDLTGWHTFARMFYSRRIDAFDVGTKVFGQVDPSLAIGALGTANFGSENAAVVRAAKTFGPKANMSAYATHFDRAGMDRNDSYGLNGWAKNGSFWGGLNVAAEGDSFASDDHAGGIDFAYDVPHHFNILHYEWIDPTFDPPLAYVPWTDRRGWDSYNEWNAEYRNGAFTGHHVECSYSDFRHYDGSEQEKGFGAYFGTATRRSNTSFGFGLSQTSFDGQFENLKNVDVTFNYNNRFRRLGVFYQEGTRGGETSRYVSSGGSYRVFRKIDLGFNLSRQDYQGVATQEVFTLGYEISPTRAMTGRVVRTGTDTNAYIAYRQAGMKGMELFVILGDPNANTTQTRLSVKAVWAF